VRIGHQFVWRKVSAAGKETDVDMIKPRSLMSRSAAHLSNTGKVKSAHESLIIAHSILETRSITGRLFGSSAFRGFRWLIVKISNSLSSTVLEDNVSAYADGFQE